MKTLSKLMINISLTLALLAFFSNYSYAQDTGNNHGNGFVDENGDGFNDNAPDADGDGIPNGMDEDYTGPKMKNANGHGHGARGFVDEDGDGINDNAMDSDGDGIPNGQDPDFVRPHDGNGNMHNYSDRNKHQYKHMKGSRANNGGGMGDDSRNGSRNAHKYNGSKKQDGRQ